MTERELHKLRRQDLLELLLSQSKEVTRQRTVIAGLEESVAQVDGTNDRLKNKLDEKDEGLGRLKERLNEKDATLEKLKRRLDEKDATIEKLKGRLDAKDALIADLQKKVGRNQSRSSKAENSRQQALLEQRDAEIARLTRRAEEKDAELERLRASRKHESEDDMLGLDQVITDFSATNGRLKDMVSTKDRQIEELYTQLKEKDAVLWDIRKEIRDWRGGRQQELESALAELRESNASLRQELREREVAMQELLERAATAPDELS
ncbi:MAG: hypothetical protein IJ594_09450 [Oscillospiraceae bacterium]|nr:hypothetical protein [Oscillospiraceae bacterium]